MALPVKLPQLPLPPVLLVLLMTLPWIRGPPKSTSMPLHGLLVMMLFRMVGADPISTPGAYWLRVGLLTPWIVNPLSTLLRPSALPNVTTGALPSPWMIVLAAPVELTTVMALPLKLMFSL